MVKTGWWCFVWKVGRLRLPFAPSFALERALASELKRTLCTARPESAPLDVLRLFQTQNVTREFRDPT